MGSFNMCSMRNKLAIILVLSCVSISLVNPVFIATKKPNPIKITTIAKAQKIASTTTAGILTTPAGIPTTPKPFDTAALNSTANPAKMNKSEIPPEFLFYGIAYHKDYFIDKTKFIEVFLNEPRPLYVTAPRNFGKTTIVSMLDSFFRLRISDNGTALSKVQLRATLDYKIFSDIYHNEQMAVFKKSAIFDANFGHFPVLRLDFKEINVDSPHLFYTSFLEIMRLRFAASTKYMNISHLNQSFDMKVLANHESGTMKTEHAALIASGKLLTKVFYQGFNRPTIVLIDDVDSPIRRMVTNGRLNHDEISELDGRISEFLRALLKDNEFLKTAFLTGRTRYASIHTDSSWGADNVKLHRFSDRSDLAETFGLTEREVKALLARKPHPKIGAERMYEELVDWYDGYFGASGLVGESRIFNTRGVIQTIHSGEASFWLCDEPPPFEAGFWIDFIGSRLYQTMLGSPANITIPERIETQNILDLTKTMKFLNGQFNDWNTSADVVIYRDTFMEHLYELGLLAYPRKTVAHRSSGVVIPNLETRAIFFELLLNAFRAEFSYSGEAEVELRKSIKALNNTRETHNEFVESIKTLFKAYFPPKEPQNLEAVIFTIVALADDLNLRQFIHVDPITAAELPSFIIANGTTGIFFKATYGLKKSPSDGLNQMFKAMSDPQYIRACVEHHIFKFILVSLHYTERTYSCGFVYGLFAPKNNTAVVNPPS